MDNFRLKISTKILDVAERLPQFKKGVISSLQNIREEQKKWASMDISRCKPPQKPDVELMQITLVMVFEHDEFYVVTEGLKRYFPKNDDIQKFIRSLENSVDKLHAHSWHNLGYIVRQSSLFFPMVTVDASLPLNIKSLSLSFERILPSVACIAFRFQLDSSVGQELCKAQNRVYLEPLEFKKFWPLSRLHHSYSMGTAKDSAIQSMNNVKDSVRKEIEGWVKKGFNWQPQVNCSAFYIDAYKISGLPEEADEVYEWLLKNRCWLDEYEIVGNTFDTLEGDGFLISRPGLRNSKYMVSDIVSKFDSDSKTELGDFLEYKLRPIIVSSVLFAVIKKHRNKIEALRGQGFTNLYKRKKFSRRNEQNIQELKRTIAIISRLYSEIKQSKNYIAYSIASIGNLTNRDRKEDVDLGRATVDNVEYQLKQVKEAASIIDEGLTNHLSVQSIYVMYKLQKRMLFLTIVVTIATVIGVVLSWDSFKSLIFN